MDKKTTRQILFRPGKPVSDALKEKANVQVENIDTTPKTKGKLQKKAEPVKELTLQERSTKLYEWLDEHPLINLNGVCLKAGVDRANFVKGIGKNKELKKDVLDKLTAELKTYGYDEDVAV